MLSHGIRGLLEHRMSGVLDMRRHSGFHALEGSWAALVGAGCVRSIHGGRNGRREFAVGLTLFLTNYCNKLGSEVSKCLLQHTDLLRENVDARSPNTALS